MKNKRERQYQEKANLIAQAEAKECAFHPKLVSNYSPEYLNEMNFLERSYMWKKRVEQKLENQRKSKVPQEVTEQAGDISQTVKLIDVPPPASMKPQEKGKYVQPQADVKEELSQFFNLNGDIGGTQARKMRVKHIY